MVAICVHIIYGYGDTAISSFQADSSFQFDPTARAVHPVESTFPVHYSVKLTGKIDNILKVNHSIAVSSLTTQSSVSSYVYDYVNYDLKANNFNVKIHFIVVAFLIRTSVMKSMCYS